MCVTCGCSNDDHDHHHHGADHAHDHAHDHGHRHPGAHASHQSPAPADAGGSRRVQVERDLLDQNNRYAGANREHFARRDILALNLVSSPGSGKTTLLVRSLQSLQGRLPVAVIEGDQQTSLDAERIRATGAAAVQINTGKGCHLDAHQVGHALEQLVSPDHGVLFIENVGNLVCPAAFDLGEAAKVVVLSCTEGADKPLKYPDMFRAARLMLITKSDLLPYVAFDVDEAVAHARRVNPAIEVLVLSTTSGAGFEAWLQWLQQARLPRTAPALQNGLPVLAAAAGSA